MSNSIKRITRVQGDTYPVVITIRRGNQPFDLTGANAEIHVADKFVNPTFTETIPAANLDSSTATFVITANVAALAANDYVAELQITDSNGYIWTPAQFTWTVKPQIV